MKKMVQWGILTLIGLLLFVNPSYAVKVVIDPGHGGSDPGAIGVNGLQEKVVNLDISLKLRDELHKRGYETVLTRTTDTTMSLSERVEFKEQQNADLFVSIHANAFRNPDAKGSLVLYYDHRYPQRNYPASAEMAALTPESKKLAQYVLDGLVSEVHTEDRGLMASSVYVVRLGSIPSILVETAFLTNWDDVMLLSNEEERLKMAIGIANGIERYMPPSSKRLLKDIVGHWAQDSIVNLYEQGIIQGENGLYLPDRPLTRAEFLAMMDRVFDFETAKLISEQDSEISIDTGEVSKLDSEPYKSEITEDTNNDNLLASDLDPSHWAYPILQKALTLQVIQGYPDGTLRPDQPITRAEVSVLFDRVWKREQQHSNAPLIVAQFDDVPKSLWFADAVYRLKASKLIQGFADNRFVPDRSMTRAEIAVILDRYLERYASDDIN